MPPFERVTVSSSSVRTIPLHRDQGFLAVINHSRTMWNNNGAPYGSTHAWGWWSMFVGLVVFSIGAALAASTTDRSTPTPRWEMP